MRIKLLVLIIATCIPVLEGSIHSCELNLPGFVYPTEGVAPIELAFSHNGKFLAVADNGDSVDHGDIALFTFDQKTGVLTGVRGPLLNGNFPTTPRPTNVVFSPSDDRLAVTSGFGSGPLGGTVDIFDVNPETGFLTNSGTFNTDNAGSSGIDYSPDGRFLAVANKGTYSTGGTVLPDITVFKTHGSTNILTKVKGPNANGNFPSNALEFAKLSYNPQGTGLIVVDEANFKSGHFDGEVLTYSINRATGALTKITGPSPKGNFFTGSKQPFGLSITPDGKIVAVASRDGSVTIFTLDMQTLILTKVDGPGANGNYDLESLATIPAFSPNNQCLGVTLPGSVVPHARGNVTTFVVNRIKSMLSHRKEFSTGLGDVALAYSPNAQFLAVANSANNEVKIFKTEIEHFIPLVITSPKNGQHLHSKRTIIKGTAKPDTKVKLKTYAADFTYIDLGSAITSKKGCWSITVNQELVGPLLIFACTAESSCSASVTVFAEPESLTQKICVNQGPNKIVVIPPSSKLPIVVTIIKKPSFGTAHLSANGKDIIYTPNKGFDGCDFVTIALTNKTLGPTTVLTIELKLNATPTCTPCK